MVVISVYIYGVKIIKKFRWERGFLKGGSMEPPLCTNGSSGYLMQLSVKCTGEQESKQSKAEVLKFVILGVFNIMLQE